MSLLHVTTPDAIAAEACADALAIALRRTFVPAGMTVGGRYVVDARYRRNAVAHVEPGDVLWPLVETLHGMIAAANASTFRVDVERMFRGELVRYDGAAGDDFAWHPDDGIWHERAPYRKLTCVLQLSDPADYDGGQLELRDEASSAAVPRAAGMCAVFPSFTSHRVTPVTRGVRMTLVTFAIGPRWR